MAKKAKPKNVIPNNGVVFKVGDLVGAKIRGFPLWPSRIEKVELVKNKPTYTVKFFGTNEIGKSFIEIKYFKDFTEAEKKCTKKGFQESLRECQLEYKEKEEEEKTIAKLKERVAKKIREKELRKIAKREKIFYEKLASTFIRINDSLLKFLRISEKLLKTNSTKHIDLDDWEKAVGLFTSNTIPILARCCARDCRKKCTERHKCRKTLENLITFFQKSENSTIAEPYKRDIQTILGTIRKNKIIKDYVNNVLNFGPKKAMIEIKENDAK